MPVAGASQIWSSTGAGGGGVSGADCKTVWAVAAGSVKMDWVGLGAGAVGRSVDWARTSDAEHTKSTGRTARKTLRKLMGWLQDSACYGLRVGQKESPYAKFAKGAKFREMTKFPRCRRTSDN